MVALGRAAYYRGSTGHVWHGFLSELTFSHSLDNCFHSHEDAIVGELWRHFLKLPVDKIPYKGREIIDWVRGKFFAKTWDEVYDLGSS